MASSENAFVSERSQAYIFTKQEFKVSQIMAILYKSKKWVIKWDINGETGESAVEREVRPINLCFWSTIENDVMIAYDVIMM